MSVTRLDSKDPTEEVFATFDFSAELGIETINGTPVVTATRDGGAADANPSAIIDGTATAANGIVSQLVVGGVDRCDYKLLCTVTTSASRVLTATSILPVRRK
jgi:hypothetical protein